MRVELIILIDTIASNTTNLDAVPSTTERLDVFRLT